MTENDDVKLDGVASKRSDDHADGQKLTLFGRRLVRMIVGVSLLFVGALIFVMIWKLANNPVTIASGPPVPPSLEILIEEPSISREDVTKIFEANVSPLIEHAFLENEAAKNRAILSFRQDFNGFRSGIPKFADDLSEWRTRIGVISSWTKDKWNQWWNNEENANSLGVYVHTKFKEHVLSEITLNYAFHKSISSFMGDLEANRNALLSEIEVVMASEKLPGKIQIPKDEYNSFIIQSQKHLSVLSAQIGKKSAIYGIATNFASDFVYAGGVNIAKSAIPALTTQVINPIIVSIMGPVATTIGSQFASAGLTSIGGATAIFAAGGGTGGSIAGPIGTGVGVLAGFVLGGITDWWMSERFKEKVIDEVGEMLSVLEKQIINGANNQPGLAATLTEANQQLKRLMRQAILEAMLERVNA